MIRLDKYLADMGIGTRQEVKKYIRQGRVSINGQVANKPEQKVDADHSNVTFDDKEVSYAKFEYYMLHKPAGVISARQVALGRTVCKIASDSSHSPRLSLYLESCKERFLLQFAITIA